MTNNNQEFKYDTMSNINILDEQKNNNYKVCVEYFDENKLNIIVNNFKDFEHLVKKKKYNPLIQLDKYLKKSRGGKINVKYIQKNNMGRYYAVGGISLGAMPKAFRHTISCDNYLDIDMVNAHPVILLHLCKKFGFECENLEKYVNEREAILKVIDKDRNTSKQCVISMINNGSTIYDNLKKKTKYVKCLKKEIKMIRMEMIMKFSDKFNKFKTEREEKNISYNHDGSFISKILCDVENLILMEMYDFYQNPKNVVLIYDGLMIDKNINPDLEGCQSYVFKKLGINISLSLKKLDNVIDLTKYESVEIEKINKQSLVDEYKQLIPFGVNKYILQILEKYKNYQLDTITRSEDKLFINFYGDEKPCPLQKYDLNKCCDVHDNPYVIFHMKLFQYDLRCRHDDCLKLKISNYCHVFDDLRFNPKVILGFSEKIGTIVKGDALDEERLQKNLSSIIRYTNLFFIYLNGYSSSLFYHIEYMKNGQRRTYAKQNLKDTLSNVYVEYGTEKKDEKGKIIGTKIIKTNLHNLWFNSLERREKSQIVVYPKKNICGDHQFNLFDKFSISYRDCRENNESCQAITEHIKNIWCKNIPEKYEYVMNWLAYCLQNPQNKTAVALVLLSKEGGGKGIIIDKLKEIYGERYYLHCQGFEDVFGNFNSQLTGKCLTYLDECTWGGNKKDSGRLKTFITEKEIQINQKGIPKITMNSNNNVIISSNEKWAVPATHKGRRYYICSLSNKYSGVSNDVKIKYFENIINCSSKAFAKFLYERDITNFNPRKWGVNEDINEQIIVGENGFISFIRSCCNDDWNWTDNHDNYREDGFMTRSLIYKSYVIYCKSSKKFNAESCQLFWNEFRKIFKGKYKIKKIKGDRMIKFGNGEDYIRILDKYLND